MQGHCGWFNHDQIDYSPTAVILFNHGRARRAVGVRIDIRNEPMHIKEIYAIAYVHQRFFLDLFLTAAGLTFREAASLAARDEAASNFCDFLLFLLIV